MTLANQTRLVLLLTIGLLLAWDIYASFFAGDVPGSISFVGYALTHHWRSPEWIAGMAAGHILKPRQSGKGAKALVAPVVGSICIGLVDVCNWLGWVYLPAPHPLVVFALGLTFGAFLWPQMYAVENARGDASYKKKPIAFDWLWKYAGLLTISCDTGEFTGWSLHFGVQRSCWKWGHSFDEYDHILEYYGCGPLFLLAIM